MANLRGGRVAGFHQSWLVASLSVIPSIHLFSGTVLCRTAFSTRLSWIIIDHANYRLLVCGYCKCSSPHLQHTHTERHASSISQCSCFTEYKIKEKAPQIPLIIRVHSLKSQCQIFATSSGIWSHSKWGVGWYQVWLCSSISGDATCYPHVTVHI